jgi:hypothetical protein
MATTSKSKSWLPSSSDKYLPIWIVAIMCGAVWVLSAQMTSAIKEICKMENRCYAASAIRENSTVAEVVGDAVKKAAEAKVAEAIAAAKPAAPTAPVAPDAKAK